LLSLSQINKILKKINSSTTITAADTKNCEGHPFKRSMVEPCAVQRNRSRNYTAHLPELKREGPSVDEFEHQ